MQIVYRGRRLGMKAGGLCQRRERWTIMVAFRLGLSRRLPRSFGGNALGSGPKQTQSSPPSLY